MTISERIFEKLKENNMSQKAFSEATGIPQSTISDWKKKNTNPASDKILIICHVLNMTPYELLSGVSEEGSRAGQPEYYVIQNGTDEGFLIEKYGDLSKKQQQRILGYIQALAEIKR